MKYCPFCMNPLSEAGPTCPHCGKSSDYEAPAHHLLPGTVLNGKFTVGAALGEGGFGITYIGKDNLLDMRVAIKEYFPNGYVSRSNTTTADISTSSTEQRKEFFDKGRERFLREAQILAKFSGEAGIVNVRDFFEANHTAYIVMEFLDGETLKNHIKRVGNLSPETALSLLMPVMNSLKKVHKMGLIHRDISPDNIMLLGEGKVKLLDFGAARDVSSIGNKSLSVMLKPGYAPEEQYRSKGNQGSWTDVYALSATLYKCITGVTPDDSTQRVFADEIKKPSELGVQISPVFEAALMKGLAVLQKDRYQTIDELLAGFTGKATAVKQTDDDDERTIGIGLDIPAQEEDERTLGFASEIPVYQAAEESEAEIPVYPKQEPQPQSQPQPQQQPQQPQPQPQQQPQYAASVPVAPVFAKGPTKVGVKPAKSRKKTIIIIVAIFIGLGLLGSIIAAITGNSDPLEGVWTYKESGTTFEWKFHSGKISVKAMGIEIGTGTYKIVNKSQVKVSIDLITESISNTVYYEIDGNTLYLDDMTLSRK